MGVELNAGIRLLSGDLFSYARPEAGNVSIDDIASALSNVCRFAGHLPYFYSVAQHAINTSRIVEPEFAFTALMHDTAEAFTNDLPTPLKYAVPVFKELEVSIESDMARRFGFQYPLPPAIKLADLQMLGLEKVHIKRDHSHWTILDGIDFEPLRKFVDLRPMTPSRARELFLQRYSELRPHG